VSNIGRGSDMGLSAVGAPMKAHMGG
jgi:hypothetical protein